MTASGSAKKASHALDNETLERGRRQALPDLVIALALRLDAVISRRET